MPRNDRTRGGRGSDRDGTRRRDEGYDAYYRRGAREAAHGYGDDRYERYADEHGPSEHGPSRHSMGFMGDRDRHGAYEREDPEQGPRAWYGDARRYDRMTGRGEQYSGGAEDGDRFANRRGRPGGYPYGGSRANEDVDRYDAYGRHVGGYRSTASGGTRTGSYSGTHDKYGPGGEYAGSHESQRGRGPKNYLRSDERIKEDLSERLSDDDVVDASDITIDVKNGVVTLSGTVAARHLKHRVEDIADHCGGVKDVENRLTVKSTASAVGGKEDAGNRH